MSSVSFGSLAKKFGNHWSTLCSNRGYSNGGIAGGPRRHCSKKIKNKNKITRTFDKRHTYETEPLAKFWVSCNAEFPELSTKAMKCLLPFATTYLCESVFSTLAYEKNKYRARLKPENDMRLL